MTLLKKNILENPNENKNQEILVELIAQIRALLNDTEELSDELMGKIAVLLNRVGKVGLHAILTDILSKPQCLVKISEHSYLHNNGFYKIPFFSCDLFIIRFHIWYPGCRSEETLHDHRWNLASTVIDGYLESEIWKEDFSSEAKKYNEYLYVDKYTVPTLNRKVNVSKQKLITYKAGDFYTLNSNILHRIISHGKELTSTLTCHSKCLKYFAKNIFKGDAVLDVKPKYLSPIELEKILCDYLEKSRS